VSVPTPNQARNASPAERPKNLVGWVHIDDLSGWYAAFELARKNVDEGAKHTDAPHSDDEMASKNAEHQKEEALAAAIRPGQPCDVGVVLVGDADVSTAVVLPIKDEASFKRGLAGYYDVRPANGGFTLAARAEKEADDAASAGPKRPRGKKTKAAPKEIHCRVRGDHAVCGFDGPAPDGLATWLESKPAPGGTSGNAIVVQGFAPAKQREELAKELEKKPKVAPLAPFVRHAELARLDLQLTRDLVASVKVTFRADPSLSPWFASNPKRAVESRVLSQWPRDATLSFAVAPFAQWLPLAKDAVSEDKVPPSVVRLSDHPVAMGSVVERGELARVVAEIEAGGDDVVKLYPKKDELATLLQGYSLVGTSEGEGGAKVSVKELADMHAKEHPKSSSRPAKELPGAMWLLPSPDAKPGPELLVADGKGAIWRLSDNKEEYLVAAAKRLMTAPPSGAPAFATFTQDSVAHVSWNTSLGSYWSLGFGDDIAGILASGMGTTPDAKPKKPGAKAPRLDPTQVTSLKKQAAEVKTALATEPKRIAVSLATKSSPPALELTTAAPVAVWHEGTKNAAGPLTLVAFPILMVVGHMFGVE